MAQIEQNELNNFVKGLVEILVNTNKISKQDSQDLIKNFKNSSKASFDDFLLSENILSKSELLPALGAYYGTPEIDVVGVLFDHNL